MAFLRFLFKVFCLFLLNDSFVSFFHRYMKKVLELQSSDFSFKMDLHVLRRLEDDFTIFGNCLFVCDTNFEVEQAQ